MNEDVKKFLETGLLEEYLLGIADEDQIPEIERNIRQHPEIKAEYEAMQSAMEQMARQHGISPPPGTKEAILVDIDRTMANGALAARPSGRNWWALAAGLAALVFSVSTLYFIDKANALHQENQQLTADLSQLDAAMQEQAAQCQIIENQFKLLSDPNTAKFILKGNQKAPDLQIVAYWNEEKQQSFLNLSAMPELSGKKCFQLWADVDGEMVNVGVLPNQSNQVFAIPFKVNATSLNVTIEPEGGSEHPTVADLVASVAI